MTTLRLLTPHWHCQLLLHNTHEYRPWPSCQRLRTVTTQWLHSNYIVTTQWLHSDCITVWPLRWLWLIFVVTPPYKPGSTRRSRDQNTALWLVETVGILLYDWWKQPEYCSLIGGNSRNTAHWLVGTAGILLSDWWEQSEYCSMIGGNSRNTAL